MLNKRGNVLVLVLGGVALIALALASYFYLQIPKCGSSIFGQSKCIPEPKTTSEETASWKTYVIPWDKKVSFRYPGNLIIDEKGEACVTFGEAVSQKIDINKPYISLCPGPEGYSLQELINKDKTSTSNLKEEGDFDIYTYTDVNGNYRPMIQPKVDKKESFTLDTYKGDAYYSSEDQTKLIDQILSTFKFTDTQVQAEPAPTNVVKLSYSLPAGWKTIQDTTKSLEVGYDPSQVNTSSGISGITFAYLAHPGSYGVSTSSYYDGGSRHAFIYKLLGKTNPVADQSKDYYEKEYSYNGWPCLVLYGLTFSASGTTWGMCPVSKTTAIFIEGPGDETATVTMLRTIKVLATF